jgi:hypothetical protein
MPSSERLRARADSGAFAALAALAALAAASLTPLHAYAQQQPAGFATERLSLAPAGAGWFAVDALDMRGGLGGAASVTTGFAHAPLRISSSDGTPPLAVVANQAFMNFGFAATYDRIRVSLHFDMPLWNKGDGGTRGGYTYTAPSVDVGSHPDTLGDARLGFDARLFGDATSAFRLGLGVQLFAPNGKREDYTTDGSFHGVSKLLVAGDVGRFTYAGHLGVHFRTLDDAPTPGSPRGEELLFGFAAGARVPVGERGQAAFVVGPELFGATAFKSLLASTTSGVEALLSARYETVGRGAQLRVKLGAGGGLHAQFGTPEWRTVLAIEVFDRGW